MKIFGLDEWKMKVMIAKEKSRPKKGRKNMYFDTHVRRNRLL